MKLRACLLALLLANAAADPVAVVNSTLVACWGDSVTAGTGANPPNGPPWPTVLATVTGNQVYNGGVGGNTSTQILTRFLAQSATWNDTTIIWSGFNNVNDAPTVEADIATMVATLTHSRYVVLGIYGGVGDATAKTQCLAINATLSATYGTHFLDAYTFLWNSYNPNDSADVAAHAAHYVPPSLIISTVHLNTAGNALIANWLAANWYSFQVP